MKDQTPAEIAAKMDLKDFLGNVKKDNYITTLLINTTYLHNKLTPQFFWMRDMTLNGNMFKPQITYDYSDKWHYTIGALFLDGKASQKGFEPLEAEGPAVRHREVPVLSHDPTHKAKERTR